ncbi:hypothetical protein JXL19_06305 [bacterium]|nr:hypothetical protein [bacterium]
MMTINSSNFKFFSSFISTILFFVLIYAKGSSCEMIIFDDFEYWSSPHNYGWHTSDPQFPVFGFGIGYGNMRTVLDLQEGSRTLEVLYTPSIFNKLEPYTIFNFDTYDPKTGEYINKKVISFKIWSQFAVESFQMFNFNVLIKTKSNKNFRINYRPVDGDSPKLADDQIIVNIGRGYQDGTWHMVVRNIEEDLQKAQPGEELHQIVGIVIQGCHFRVDEIHFHDDMDFMNNHPPELWRIGPQYATIFTEYFLVIAARDPDGDFLEFQATIGGYGANGIGPTNFLYRLPEDPNDPTAGVTPNIVGLYFIPRTFDDLVITIRVTDGLLSDVETFTLSVVNFPTAGINHPPYLEQLNDVVGYIGKELNIPILARDIDSTDILTYSATIDGLPSYQYGPWQQSILDPFSGVINFTPAFEGRHWIDIIVRDSRGMIARGGFELTVVNPGATWLNHAPVVTKTIQNPQVVLAGQDYSIPIEITDPDGDKLYYSCNIGTVTERQDGIQGCVFNFFTHFPGLYIVNIVAFDIRGAFTEETFLMDVQPWWSL